MSMATENDILMIDEAVESYSSGIWDCGSLHYNGDQTGAITVKFSVGADGKVIPPVSVVSTVEAPDLVACIKAAVESWEFAPPEEPPVNLTKVYNFQP